MSWQRTPIGDSPVPCTWQPPSTCQGCPAKGRLMCRHCPYWAEVGSILRCHANYGVIKIWRYRPGPMSRMERLRFIIGALVWLGFPFPFLLVGREYLLALIGVSAAISGVIMLSRSVCSRCIDFSCPMNTIPKELVDTYLRRNPQIRIAWESVGYRLDRS